MVRGINKPLNQQSGPCTSVQGWPWWASGAIALTIIATLILLPMGAMIVEAGTINWSAVIGSTYLQRVVIFSVTQALWSTILSLVFAIPVALALSHKPHFRGRTTIVALFSLSLVIPTIVAIYGIVAVYGRTGWLSSSLGALGIQPLKFYGMPGILIAHVFFNMPLATRILMIGLEGIPQENWRLARQLGMGPLAVFRFLEWPTMRGQIPGLTLLIFTLCFTSFAIVMTLGGGPRATTIEVAIYQSLRFDFNIQQAVALACIQMLICGVLMALSTMFRHNKDLNFNPYTALVTTRYGIQNKAFSDGLWDKPGTNLLHWLVIAIGSLFVLLPLLALAFSALNAKTISVLLDGITSKAVVNTIVVSLTSATITLALALSLLLTTRHIRIRMSKDRMGQWLQLAGNGILVLPPLVLGTGLFLLLRPYADVFSLALLLVIAINSLMALPFALRVLDGPIMATANQHDKLLQSLDISGWNRLRWIDWPQLRRPIALSAALSATLSSGDLSAIALFGSERVRTLPLLLYQRMGSYRLEEAAVTAGLLLLLCLVLFTSLQTLIGGRKHAAA